MPNSQEEERSAEPSERVVTADLKIEKIELFQQTVELFELDLGWCSRLQHIKIAFMRFFIINGLGGNCSQATDPKCIIAIHVSAKDLANELRARRSIPLGHPAFAARLICCQRAAIHLHIQR